jgi:hypothetical protein
MVKDRSQSIKPSKSLPEAPPTSLKGWQQISKFLGQSTAVAQRWAGEGMPVRRQGRYVETTVEELSRWLGKESGTKEPVRIATDDADLSADLKRGLAELKHQKEAGKPKRKK